jgi:hypothetical protein
MHFIDTFISSYFAFECSDLCEATCLECLCRDGCGGKDLAGAGVHRGRGGGRGTARNGLFKHSNILERLSFDFSDI